MRWRDADHLDLTGFYARRPQAGRWYRLGGYALIAVAMVAADARGAPWAVLIAALALWFAAWAQEVGAAWRGAAVAAALAAAVLILRERSRGAIPVDLLVLGSP